MLKTGPICSAETTVSNYLTQITTQKTEDSVQPRRKPKIAHSFVLIKGEKIKVVLEQAMKAQRGSRGIAPFFL
jgi:hypothetical protein